MHQSKTIHLS